MVALYVRCAASIDVGRKFVPCPLDCFVCPGVHDTWEAW